MVMVTENEDNPITLRPLIECHGCHREIEFGEHFFSNGWPNYCRACAVNLPGYDGYRARVIFDGYDHLLRMKQER